MGVAVHIQPPAGWGLGVDSSWHDSFSRRLLNATAAAFSIEQRRHDWWQPVRAQQCALDHGQHRLKEDVSRRHEEKCGVV